MSTVELLKPVLEGGIKSVNFFNGRLLSAEDLRAEQEASRGQYRRLGQAIGEGIAYGLEVSETDGVSTRESPVVTVQPGLAINRRGEMLSLRTRVDLALVRQTNGSAATGEAPAFKACKPIQPGVYMAGAGVYLLVIAPAEGSEGRAPVSGLGNLPAQCSRRYNVAGVQFRLIQMNMTQEELSDTKHLRNLAAYKCFGTEALKPFFSNPFAEPLKGHGLLDDLRDSEYITDCDVPLAIIYWTTKGMQFVDIWSVRRRLTRPAVTDRWNVILGDRALSEGEARLLQFQEQIEAIMQAGPGTTASIQMTDYFRYLPAAGIIPFTRSYIQSYYQKKGGKASIKITGQDRGFSPENFFKNLTNRDPMFIEGAKIERLIRDSFSYPAIDLTSKEMLWLYLVRENIEAINKGGLSPPQPYMIFASGHMPFYGEARYDVARWDYSNYV